MVEKLNFGLRIPSVHPLNVDDLRAFVQRAEALGYHSLWVGDHTFYRVDVPHPLHLLTWVAALTSRVRLGTAIMLGAYQNPVLLAKEAATLDALSGGRLTLGISIGGTEAEYKSIGVPMNQRVGRLLENIRIMRRLWKDDEVAFEGRYNQIEGASVKPKPVQQPGVPIYIGAGGEAMFRRLARVADGWVGPGTGQVEDFVVNAAKLRQLAEEQGRDPDKLGWAKLHNISVASDKAAAVELAETQWKSYYGARYNVEAGTIYGSPAECAERLKGFLATDAPELTLALEPAGLGLDQLERLKEASELVK
jgi:probable F420-dependent oxidoreductase